MTRPEEALAQARAEARRLRAEGIYPPQEPGAGAAPAVSIAQLLEWAVIEPDLGEVRSVRRYGRPVTLFKRALVRLLMQYTGQLAAQQTRFNVNLLARVRRLEERIDALERDHRP